MVDSAVTVVDVVDLHDGEETVKEFQLADAECIDKHRCSELVQWIAHRRAHQVCYWNSHSLNPTHGSAVVVWLIEPQWIESTEDLPAYHW